MSLIKSEHVYTISELVETLNKIKNDYGDIKVFANHSDFAICYDEDGYINLVVNTPNFLCNPSAYYGYEW